MSFSAAGYEVFGPDARVRAWAGAAAEVARGIAGGAERRHGGTWVPGVDALPNGRDGAIGGVPLAGPWEARVRPPEEWHRAQLSVVFQGYPGRDEGETEAAHGYRLRRDAAHVDGLLPEGPARRRHLREPHGFILGIALNMAAPGASPLVVWEGSHLVMRAAFARFYSGLPPEAWGDADVTEAYQAARRAVFERCPRRELPLLPGQSVLLDRHLLHGVAPWRAGAWCAAPGRMVAYFRPLLSHPGDWLG